MIKKSFVVLIILVWIASGYYIFDTVKRHIGKSNAPTVSESTEDIATVDSGPSSTVTFTAEEIVGLTNTYRASKSLSPLTESSGLKNSACSKANDMKERDYWSHETPEGTDPWDFFKANDYAYRTAGENLAYGQTTANQVVVQWINSPAHEKNLVGDFSEIGVCSVFSPNFQKGAHIITVAHYGSPL